MQKRRFLTLGNWRYADTVALSWCHMLTPQGAQEMDPKSSELVAETKQTVVQLKEQLESKVGVARGMGAGTGHMNGAGHLTICNKTTV